MRHRRRSSGARHAGSGDGHRRRSGTPILARGGVLVGRRSAPMTTEGLRLSRSLSEEGIDLEGLRSGGGRRARPPRRGVATDPSAGPCRRGHAHHRPPRPVHVAARRRGHTPRARSDPSDVAGAPRPKHDPRRSCRRSGRHAVADERHPMFRAGDASPSAVPTPRDSSTTSRSLDPQRGIPAAVLRGCADLAAGVPALTWRAVDLADVDLDPPAAALIGWRKLRRLCEPATARQWDSLRRVHPLAQTVVAVIADGLRPGGTIAANSKSIGDATRTMRGLGIAWQPEPRRWAIADPLLSAYARDHAPPWVERHPR